MESYLYSTHDYLFCLTFLLENYIFRIGGPKKQKFLKLILQSLEYDRIWKIQKLEEGGGQVILNLLLTEVFSLTFME